MKTDRELLELAAKACCDSNLYSRSVDGMWFNKKRIGHSDGYGNDYHREWNPLADDGDALRLAVKLHLDIKFRDGCTYAMQSGKRIGAADGAVETCHRRAIVRAAAAIGEEMP